MPPIQLRIAAKKLRAPALRLAFAALLLSGPVCAQVIDPTTATEAKSPSPSKGGTLNWIVTPEPSSFLPLTTTAGSSAELGPKVVEGLLAYDYELNPRPLLATEWALSPDGLTYTFKLRKGVKWHDGTDFTSADVAYSILALKQFHPRGRSTFANVQEVQTPDPHTAVIVLSKPAPYLLTALAGAESPIIPKHLYEGTEVVSNKYNNSPIGTGPYVFKEWVKGSHLILERNPAYWDQPKPHLDRIVVRFIPDAVSRAAALESKAADLASQAIPLSDVKRFKDLPAFRVDTTDWPYVSSHQQLIFNLDSPILKNRDVRLAISNAVDVEALNKVVWLGYGTVSAAAIGRASAKYHNNDIKYYPVDLKQAEALLDSAGYKKGADGYRFKLRLLYNPFQEKRAADFVRQSLSRIGIDAVIENYDFATYVTKAYTDRAFDITLEALANVFDPTVGVQRVFWSKNFKIGLPFSNAAHYVNPQVDTLLESAAVEINEGKRRQDFLDFQLIVHQDIPSIEFGANPNIAVIARKVKNYAPTGEGLRGSFSDLYIEATP